MKQIKDVAVDSYCDVCCKVNTLLSPPPRLRSGSELNILTIFHTCGTFGKSVFWYLYTSNKLYILCSAGSGIVGESRRLVSLGFRV